MGDRRTMADQDADTKFNPLASEDVLPEDSAYAQSSETDGKKVVQFPQQENSELEIKRPRRKRTGYGSRFAPEF